MKRILGMLVVVGLLAACSSVTVNTDYSDDADFSQFKTFQYQDSDNSIEGKSALAHQRTVSAIRQGMTSSGLTETDEDPDVFVTYAGATDQQEQFTTAYMGGSSWHRGGRHMGWGMGSSTTRSTTVTQGTLIIDVVDAGKNELVWRAVAETTLSSKPETNTNRINSGVERAFRDFPPQ